MKITYIDKNFSAKTLTTIDQANAIIKEYMSQGFDLTLRQLYYQMVAAGTLPNKMSEYKRLGSILNDARLAGLVSWRAITDRTRNVRTNPHWSEPKNIMDSAAESYLEDRWHSQEYRPEVWIEKDALIGVIEGLCSKWDVPAFSCRGYVSQSEMWNAAAMRMRSTDWTYVIIHLGDHDPSGIDMTRDIEDRLNLFGTSRIKVERIALNMDQVADLQLPPNPAKLTDSRARDYLLNYGRSSWELDALKPPYMHKIIEDKIKEYIDFDQWEEDDERINTRKATLQAVADNYQAVEDYCRDEGWID